MIAKLERTQSIAYQNKDKIDPHKQWEVHQTIDQQQQNQAVFGRNVDELQGCFLS